MNLATEDLTVVLKLEPSGVSSKIIKFLVPIPKILFQKVEVGPKNLNYKQDSATHPDESDA